MAPLSTSTYGKASPVSTPDQPDQLPDDDGATTETSADPRERAQDEQEAAADDTGTDDADGS